MSQDNTTIINMKKFHELVKYYNAHPEEPDRVAVLYKIVGINNDTLNVFYELSCGMPQFEVHSGEGKKSYYSKHATSEKYCYNIIASTTLARTMIKQDKFDKITRKFTCQLRDAYRTDTEDDGTYEMPEMHEIEFITPHEPYDSAGFILKFTNSLAIAALEEGRKMKSIDTLYEIFDEIQTHKYTQ